MTATTEQVFEGFSLTHAQILDGATSFHAALDLGLDYDVYGVDDASLDPSADSYENKGDDVVLSTWNWLNLAQVKVRAGYVSFPLIAVMTGQSTTSSSSAGEWTYEVDLWHEDSFNVGSFPMLLRMPSRDAAGNVRLLDIGLYKVEFAPLTFDGPKYKDGLKVNYMGKALPSAENETGVAFPDGKKRIGKLINRPG